MITDQSKKDRQLINNDYYDSLHQRWYEADDDPVALLRAEANFRNPWIVRRLCEFFSYKMEPVQILDVGCGGGLLSNSLARAQFEVTGVDLSSSSLEVAKKEDDTHTVHYVQADAYALPFRDNNFDVVTCTDLLEHASNPQAIIREMARVLKPGGFFFFHTFNKTWISNLLVVKGVEWFVKNTPEKLHVFDMFIAPGDLKKWMSESDIETIEIHGVRPVLLQFPMMKLLLTGKVSSKFRFKWSGNLKVSYTGIGRKAHNKPAALPPAF